MKKIDTRGLRDLRRVESGRRRERVLYVEDSDDNWHVANLQLSDNYEILRARNAREACRMVQEHGAELSAILMDVELRGSELNGIELTSLFRGKLPRSAAPDYARAIAPITTLIIFVTAHGAKYSDAHLLLSGGNKVIPKPVDFALVSLTLTQLHLSNITHKHRRP